jgi:hypothetical protein
MNANDEGTADYIEAFDEYEELEGTLGDLEDE